MTTAISGHEVVSGAYSTLSLTALTMKRDVSDLLDLWAHKWTPLLNRIKWAGGSGALKVEWISEHLGYGYVQNVGTIATNATNFAVLSGGEGGLSGDVALKQIQEGTLLYCHASGDTSADCFWTVTTIGSGSDPDISFSILAAQGDAVIPANSKIYIVGHFANEGSVPFPDISRARTVLSNNFAIARKDIKITGSQAETDMYAVANDPQHQMAMRLLEMQYERERSICFSKYVARSLSVAAFFKGAFDYLDGYTSSANVDNSTTTLTEATFNDLVAGCWEAGGTPSVFACEKKQARLFTSWDSNKVRTKPDAKMGGHWVTSYLTDMGLEIDIIPMRYWPMNIAFLLDTDKCSMVPKKNRKLIVEKLGKDGDYTEWQMISEYTFIMRGYDKGQHGMFMRLT